MQDFLDDPRFQSGIMPFAIALALILISTPLKHHGAGRGLHAMAFAFAFFFTAFYIAGFDLFPLSSTRKILLTGLVAVAVGIAMDFSADRLPNRVAWIPLAIIAAVGTLWFLWPVLKQRESWSAVLGAATAAAVFTAWMAAAGVLVRRQPLSGFVITVVLGFGVGISTVLGASALLGQLGIAAGTAAGAYLLWVAITDSGKPPYAYLFPAMLVPAMLGISGIFTAELPWYVLVPLAMLPLAAWLPLAPAHSLNGRWKQLIILAMVCVPAGALAVAIAWMVSGPPPF